MACRVGITTRPEERKEEWRQKHPDLRNWEQYGPYSTKSEAQRIETELARKFGCEAHPGGQGAEYDKWFVYKFEYST